MAERVDSVLDPLAVQDQQRFTAEDLRRLPVTTVEEAIALSSGAVGEEIIAVGAWDDGHSFSTASASRTSSMPRPAGSLGVRVPPDALAEASLVTNGFSARYGQAVSALVNLATRDGGDRSGAARGVRDRPPPRRGRRLRARPRSGLRRPGPLPAGIRFLGVIDLSVSSTPSR
ncbi:MAG: hypothetical protein U0133_06340 [Gemmatimonadales bacterium]